MNLRARIALVALLFVCSFANAQTVTCGGSSYRINEGEDLTVELVRTGDLSQPVTAAVYIAYADHSQYTYAVMIGFGNSTSRATYTFRNVDDNVWFGTMRGYVVCGASDGPFSRVPFEMVDNEPSPTVKVAAELSFSENDPNPSIPLTISPPLGHGTTLPLTATLISGTATVGSDLATATASVEGWWWDPHLPLPIVNDSEKEPDETFRVVFSGYTDLETVVTITANDDPLPAFSAPSYTFDESQRNGVVTILRPGDTSVAQTIRMRFDSNDPRWAGTIVDVPFAIGETSKDVQIPLDDTWYTGDRTMQLVLLRDDETGGSATVTVKDNEPKPTLRIEDAQVDEGTNVLRNLEFTVTLSGPVGAPLQFATVVHNGTAIQNEDFTVVSTPRIAAGETSTTVSVAIISDSDIENDETLTVELLACCSEWVTFTKSTAIGRIIDDDAHAPEIHYQFESLPNSILESAGNLRVRIFRTGDLTKASNATINVTNTKPGSSWSMASIPVAFAASEVSKYVNIDIDDSVYFGDVNARIDLVSTNGVEDGGVVQILEDEALPVFAVSNVTASEGPNAVATFVLTAKPAYGEDVAIDVHTEQGTATYGEDLLTFGSHTTLRGGSSIATFNVALLNDDASEGDEQFKFIASVLRPGDTRPETIEALGTIVDDDGVRRTLSPDGESIGTGDSLTMTIDLGEPFAHAETITLTSSDPSVLRVPEKVDVAAGQQVVTFEAIGLARGTSFVSARFGEETLRALVEVHTVHTIVPSSRALVITLDTTETLRIELAPAAESTTQVMLRAQNGAIAGVANSVSIAPGASATINVLGKSLGTTTLELTLPAQLGGTTISIPVQVVPATTKRRGVRH